MEFLKTYKVTLTPLSPIHIGCGEDFEPTNYVIDAQQQLLYGFDPSRAVLPDDVAQSLAACSVRPNPLASLHKNFFLNEHKAAFVANSSVLIAVEPDVVAEYKKRLNGDFNQFFIERHAHQAYSHQLPYIPGSALKGALRTGWLNRLLAADSTAPKNAANQMELALFKEVPKKFQTSPLRLLKVSDLMPKSKTARALLSANYRYKDGLPHTKKLPPLVKESLLPGQYRKMSGTITLHDLIGKKGADSVPVLRPELCQIVKDCHAHHKVFWEKEMKKLCDNGLVKPEWKNTIEDILASTAISGHLESGRAALVRLGRYGGAESKTLPLAAHIKIHKGDYRKETTTCWLAKERGQFVPFGWALLEIDPQDDLPELKDWCEKETQNRPDMREKYAALVSDREKAEQDAAQRNAEREARLAAERQAAEDLAKAEVERKARLAELSEAGRQVEIYKNACAEREQSIGGRKNKPYGTDYQQAKALADAARVGEGWSAVDKRIAAEAIEYWLPRLETIDIKELRKKLKLAELKEVPV
ncbi:MAG: type III-A CRISPR-associated RAMP protein Csm5 [Zoogloeaceae bacterium]|jgi:CRISPR-associated protein Csm5|nr:type III-A CRISPR-associated RAMP protein Csm5 [Zoogloeaceae bacterium]